MKWPTIFITLFLIAGCTLNSVTPVPTVQPEQRQLKKHHHRRYKHSNASSNRNVQTSVPIVNLMNSEGAQHE